MNSPGGITTISGHPSQSLRVSPGLYFVVTSGLGTVTTAGSTCLPLIEKPPAA